MSYKTGDTLAAPAGTTLPRLAPTPFDVDKLQTLVDLYGRHGVSLSIASASTILAEESPISAAYADLSEKVEDVFDASSFKGPTLAQRLESVREDCQGLAHKGGLLTRVFKDVELSVLTLSSGKVEIDEEAKNALYALTLTKDEADFLNDFDKLVALLNGLKGVEKLQLKNVTSPALRIDSDTLNFVKRQDVLFDIVSASHVYPELEVQESDGNGEAEGETPEA